MPFYEELVAATAPARERFMQAPALVRGLRGEIDVSSYLAFLEQAFQHVRHTVPLLMACGARIPARLEWLRAAIGEYIIEEQGHHEWILSDIRAAGGDADAVEQCVKEHLIAQLRALEQMEAAPESSVSAHS